MSFPTLFFYIVLCSFTYLPSLLITFHTSVSFFSFLNVSSSFSFRFSFCFFFDLFLPSNKCSLPITLFFHFCNSLFSFLFSLDHSLSRHSYLLFSVYNFLLSYCSRNPFFQFIPLLFHGVDLPYLLVNHFLSLFFIFLLCFFIPNKPPSSPLHFFYFLSLDLALFRLSCPFLLPVAYDPIQLCFQS